MVIGWFRRLALVLGLIAILALAYTVPRTWRARLAWLGRWRRA